MENQTKQNPPKQVEPEMAQPSNPTVNNAPQTKKKIEVA